MMPSTFVCFFAFSTALFGVTCFAKPHVNAKALHRCSAEMNGKLPKPLPSDFTFSGNVRRYYIAAEQVAWNYVPSGWDNWMGVPIEASTRAALSGYAPPALGYTWDKALYHGYTNASFQDYSPKPPTLGSQGPTMRAEVGDMLEILFVNGLTKNYASMHSMGLAYSKNNEGSDYFATQMKSPIDNAVPPGDCVVLKWLVNDGSAPTGGATSHLWGYHSYVTMEQDLNAGLVGSTIVYSRGEMAKTMAQNREFVLSYIQYNEAHSFLSAANAKRHGMAANHSLPVAPKSGQGYGNSSLWHPQVTNLGTSYQLSSTMAPTYDTLSGLMYANNYPFEVCVNDPTIWYISAWGSDPHTFHMHGNGFVYQGLNLATIGLTPGNMLTLHSTMNGVGNWQLICHISGHQTGGMVDNYIVYPTKNCPLPKLSG